MSLQQGEVMERAELGARRAGPESLVPFLISAGIVDSFSEPELPHV